MIHHDCDLPTTTLAATPFEEPEPSALDTNKQWLSSAHHSFSTAAITHICPQQPRGFSLPDTRKLEPHPTQATNTAIRASASPSYHSSTCPVFLHKLPRRLPSSCFGAQHLRMVAGQAAPFCCSSSRPRHLHLFLSTIPADPPLPTSLLCRLCWSCIITSCCTSLALRPVLRP